MFKNFKKILILGGYILAFLLFLKNKDLGLLLALVKYFDSKLILI